VGGVGLNQGTMTAHPKIMMYGTRSFSVADPKQLISYPTFQLIKDPNPTFQIISDPDPTYQVTVDPDPFGIRHIFFKFFFQEIKYLLIFFFQMLGLCQDLGNNSSF